MKVLVISTNSHNGGAGIAALRLVEALNGSGTDTNMLAYYEDKTHPNVAAYVRNKWMEARRFLYFVGERLCFLPHEVEKEIRFFFSLANTGEDLSKHPMVLQADVIHLHWFNKGFLSLKGLGNLLSIGKPVVWTLHDMWAFTGGCHYNYKECENYKGACGNCPMVKRASDNDISFQIWQQKKKVYSKGNLYVITVSEWLGRILETSALMKNIPHGCLPNPIDTDVYHPVDKREVREQLNLSLEKDYLLFVAMNTRDERKGFRYLIEALDVLESRKDLELIVIGKADEDVLGSLPLPVNYLGVIRETEKMVMVYNASDIYITPTLQDNLPNTVMESLACGTPVVAFETGGVPEMVSHKQEGYLCPQKDTEGMAKGIDWILEDKDRRRSLSINARNKVLENYAYNVVAAKYGELYRSLLSSNNTDF